MLPNQLLLSPDDSEAVRQLAQQTGKAAEVLLHEAVEKLMDQAALQNWQKALRRVEGMWADHPAAPDTRQLRAGWQDRAERLTDPANE